MRKAFIYKDFSVWYLFMFLSGYIKANRINNSRNMIALNSLPESYNMVELAMTVLFTRFNCYVAYIRLSMSKNLFSFA